MPRLNNYNIRKVGDIIEKRIEEFPDYGIDENGIITSYKKDIPKIMTPKIGKDGYLIIGLRRDNKKYFRAIHRLVAQTFLQNTLNKEQVNHKDGNIKNNNVSNLEWCTLQENIAYSFRVLGRKGEHTTSKKCELYHKNIFVNVFEDIKTACLYASNNFKASYSGLYKYYVSKSCKVIVIE